MTFRQHGERPPNTLFRPPQVLAGSDYVAEQLRRDPALAWRLLEDGLLLRSLHGGEMRSMLQHELQDVADEDVLAQRLRRFRQLHQVRIIWRDLTRSGVLLCFEWGSRILARVLAFP